jgi:hypothetical protein
MENSKNLKGEFYVNSVLDDMSYEELYGWMIQLGIPNSVKTTIRFPYYNKVVSE